MKLLDPIDYLLASEIMELFDYRLFTDWANWQVLKELDSLGLDIETTSSRETGNDPFNYRIRLIQVYLPNIDEVAILDLWKLTAEQSAWLTVLLQVLEDPKVQKIIQNAIFDAYWFRVKFGISIRNIVDTLILSQLDKAGKYQSFLFDAQISKPNSLESLCAEFGFKHDKQYQFSDWASIDLDPDQIGYAGRDAITTYKIGKKLLNRVMDIQPDVVQAELGAISAFVELNFQGLPVGNPNYLFRLHSRYHLAATQAREKLSKLLPSDPNQDRKIEEYWENPKLAKRQSDKTAIVNPVTGVKASYIEIPKPKPFNPASPSQIAVYLRQRFGEESIKRMDKKTGEEKDSTAKDIIFELYTDNPEATELRDLINFRGVQKAASTLESYWRSFDPHRQAMNVAYHCLGSQGMGRSASGDKNDPLKQNAQNVSKPLPSHQAYGLPPIRSFMSARPGYSLLEIDLAASHIQFARTLSNDSSLQAAYKSGLKIHYYTLSAILELEGTKATPEECQELVINPKASSNQQYYEYLYKLSKQVIYSYLNRAGGLTLQQQFFKYEQFVTVENCKKYLEACSLGYQGLTDFQNKVFSNAQNNMEEVIYRNKLTGEEIPLGRHAKVTTLDGAVIWIRPERTQDHNGRWQTRLKISDVLSPQWMRPEATVMKTALKKIHDLCVDEWSLENARLVNFSHDSVIVEIRTELLPEIAPVCCDVVDNCMRVYIPDYMPESGWESQVLKYNWGKYNWEGEKPNLAGGKRER